MHPPQRRARVVFVIGRGGGGHKASARAVRDSLPESLRDAVEFLDGGYAIEACLLGKKEPRASGWDCDEVYNFMLRHGFACVASFLGLGARFIANACRSRIIRGLTRLWSATSGGCVPQMVVSFVPHINAVMREALAEVNPEATYVTVVTDFASSPEHCWIEPYEHARGANHLIVAGTSMLVRQCADLGYPETQVLSTGGMAVHPCFYTSPPVSSVSSGRAERADR